LEHKQDCLIPAFLEHIQLELETGSLERDLADYFPEFIERQDELFTLSWNILVRVLGFQPAPLSRVDPERAFGFRLACFRYYGPRASLVFAGLNPADLTEAQILQLIDIPVLWSFLGSTFKETCLRALTLAAEYQELSRRQSAEIAELRVDCDDLRKRCIPFEHPDNVTSFG
jgi:hypothetical protein